MSDPNTQPAPQATAGAPRARPPRFAGIDYGAKRIGLALADPGGRIATPERTLEGTGNPARDAEAVRAWAAKNEADALVVGLPLNMDGTDSEQTRITRAFARALAAPGTVVELWDERLSSFQADQLLAQFESARGKRAKRTMKGDSRRDALAALVILRSFLEARAAAQIKPNDVGNSTPQPEAPPT